MLDIIEQQSGVAISTISSAEAADYFIRISDDLTSGSEMQSEFFII